MRKGQTEAGGQGSIWRDVGSSREKIQPEELKEDGDAQSGFNVAADQPENQAQGDGTIKEADIDGESAQGYEAKKKLAAKRVRACMASIRFRVGLPDGLHVHLTVGNTPEIKGDSVAFEEPEAFQIFFAQGHMVTELILAGSVMNVPDVEHSKVKSRFIGFFRIMTGGKKEEDCLALIIGANAIQSIRQSGD
jgi:hypothetical protein